MNLYQNDNSIIGKLDKFNVKFTLNLHSQNLYKKRFFGIMDLQVFSVWVEILNFCNMMIA